MRALALCLVALSLLVGLPGCGGSGVPQELQAPPQEPITPENDGDGPEGFAQPESPF